LGQVCGIAQFAGWLTQLCWESCGAGGRRLGRAGAGRAACLRCSSV